jgi:hypothetical protein
MTFLQAVGVAMVTVGATGLIMMAAWGATKLDERQQAHRAARRRAKRGTQR